MNKGTMDRRAEGHRATTSEKRGERPGGETLQGGTKSRFFRIPSTYLYTLCFQHGTNNYNCECVKTEKPDIF